MAVSTQLRKPQLYADFRTSFSTHPIKKDLVIVTNEDAVIESIRNLLYTGEYERFWKPEINCGLKKFLFEPVSKITEQAIRDAIRTTITTFETRAELIDVIVTVNADQNSYHATIVFAVINKEAPISFSMLFNRLR